MLKLQAGKSAIACAFFQFNCLMVQFLIVYNSVTQGMFHDDYVGLQEYALATAHLSTKVR